MPVAAFTVNEIYVSNAVFFGTEIIFTLNERNLQLFEQPIVCSINYCVSFHGCFFADIKGIHVLH